MSFGYGGSGRGGQQQYGGHGQQISSGHVGSPPTNFGRGKVQLTYATTAKGNAGLLFAMIHTGGGRMDDGASVYSQQSYRTQGSGMSHHQSMNAGQYGQQHAPQSMSAAASTSTQQHPQYPQYQQQYAANNVHRNDTSASQRQRPQQHRQSQSQMPPCPPNANPEHWKW